MSSTSNSQYAGPEWMGLTPEQWATISHYDAGPKLLASIWSLFVVATIFLALRVYCRVLKRRSLWWDDYILVGAWVSKATVLQRYVLAYTQGC
jgi:uncharacterized BrkB/YihY/UPF0761 family membrane protein